MRDYILFSGKTPNLGYKEIKRVEILKKIKQISNQGIIIMEGGKDNRQICENKKVDILLSPERGAYKDFIHHRNSGLNQVLCKLMQKNEISYGINIKELIFDKNKKALIGRISQNIKLCRKYKIRMMAASFAEQEFEMRDQGDMQSLLKVLGMTPKEAKEALNWEKCKKGKIKILK